MRILITNDDGFDSKGIAALVRKFQAENEITIAAPAVEQSGTGHNVSFYRDVIGKKEEYPGTAQAYRIWGSPADCAYLGIQKIMQEKPDLVISGINCGSNLSLDNIYSGTIGAATEAIILGIPCIAVSLDQDIVLTEEAFIPAADAVSKMMPYYLLDPECSRYVLSINVPAIPKDRIGGYRVTSFDSRRQYQRGMEIIPQKDGKVIFHSTSFASTAAGEPREADGDIAAVEQGYISLTPIGLDWVDHSRQEKMKQWTRLSL